ncbi:YjcZ family sporulation protein [Neobacillus niacini]|uniref:YjcZ family sporulation protein n=1 Tax=Neobacillus niacini TaxID=86668 RepID=UPI002FFDFE53
MYGHYGHGFGGDCCGFGYPAQVGGVGWGCGTFVLIVVLFILLIIIGASWC